MEILIFSCFVLVLADDFCCAWLVYPLWWWYWCPEIGTSSIDWAQLSRLYLKTETESNLRNVVFLNKNRQKVKLSLQQAVEAHREVRV
jgi:hypothetical protein